MTKRPADSPAPPMFTVAPRRTGPGPVYQGVSKQIRALVKDDAALRDRAAGTIAAARSLAASIDRASGHDDPRAQASGMQLASMHGELRELLAVLSPEAAAADPFQKFLDELDADGPGLAANDEAKA